MPRFPSHRTVAAAGWLGVLALVLTPTAGRAGTKTTTTTMSGTWNFADSDEFSYVLVRPTRDYQSGTGQTKDFERASSLRKSYSHDFLYVRQGNRAYVIDDPALIERAEDMLVPQEMLGRQQGLLGGKQAAMGAQQAKLGSQQAALGAEQAKLGAEMARLSAEISSAANHRRDTSALEEELHRIARRQSDLGSSQSELGREQARLGADQAELGQQQSEFGRQSAELARKINREIAALVDEAVSAGRAKPLR